MLGATFAAMEPGRVSRVILDGVVDTDDYYDGWCEPAACMTFLLISIRDLVVEPARHGSHH